MFIAYRQQWKIEASTSCAGLALSSLLPITMTKTKLRATVWPGHNVVNLKAAVAGSWNFTGMRDSKKK